MWIGALKVKNRGRKPKTFWSVFRQSCYLMGWNDIGMMGKPIHQDSGDFREPACLPAWSWGLETGPRLGPAQPSDTGGWSARPASPSQTWGHFFQGHSHLKLMEKVPANWSSGSSSAIPPVPKHGTEASPLFASWQASSPASCIMCLKMGLALICVQTGNGLQPPLGISVVWGALSVVPEARAKKEGMEGFCSSLLHWAFIWLSTEACGLMHRVEYRTNTLNCLVDSDCWISELGIEVI